MGTILVISSDLDVSNAVCTFLSQHYPTVSCRPDSKAEQLAARADIDVVIVDVKTPEAEELRVVCKLKKRIPDLPVIFLSLYAAQLSRSKDTQELFYDALFFPKPFDNEAVAAAVALLRTRRGQPAEDGAKKRPTKC